MSLKQSVLISGVVAMFAAGCGPMPGFRGPNSNPDDESATTPRGAPAPAPEDDSVDGPWSDTDEGPTEDPNWETPPSERPPAPVYRPPVAEAPVAQPAPQPTPSPASGVRIIELNADSAYVIDDTRGLCFFRFKGTLATIDCAKLTQAAPVTPPVAPVAPQPAPQPVAPAPAPVTRDSGVPVAPGAFTTVDLRRFQDAFSAIYCDRQSGQKVQAEQRIAEAGLAVVQYGEIETWMADDDARWQAATDKARASCRR